MKASIEKFHTFRKLHSDFLVLPGACDLLSAMMLQECGYPAVATTSVGLGYPVGCPQEYMIPKEQMLELVGNICRAVSVPVELDFESGYSDTAEGVVDSVLEVIDLGVVAIRLEDSDGIPGKGMRPPEEHCERIRAARRAGEKAGVPLFITGRTDPFWNDDGETIEAKIAESIRRSNLYLEAGADAIFVSARAGMNKDTVTQLVKGIKGEFATLYKPGGPSIAELKAIGVKRLTAGAMLINAQMAFLEKALRNLQKGDISLFEQFRAPSKKLNDQVKPYWESRKH
jgi:2-methylisocitrate lyase-like PEP mutase family enzyme